VLDSLNAQQRDVVHDTGHVLVVAQPGSGKTSVIAKKAARFGLDRYNVLCVAFSRDAAKEMDNRVQEICGEKIKNIVTGTFHALALKGIRNSVCIPHYEKCLYISQQ